MLWNPLKPALWPVFLYGGIGLSPMVSGSFMGTLGSIKGGTPMACKVAPLSDAHPRANPADSPSNIFCRQAGALVGKSTSVGRKRAMPQAAAIR